MYPVSEAYKRAMKSEEQEHDLRGMIGRFLFGRENVLRGSLTITNQCSDSFEIKIGQVYIGELQATFIGTGIPRYSWKGLDITVYFGLKLADGTYEEIPLGIYTVSEAEWTSSGVAVTAYDYMAKFDKSYNEVQTAGDAYTLAAFACEQCGVQFGMAEEEMAGFANGSADLSVYSDNDIETWRDYISWLSQTLGCFATIDRRGQLVFRKYGGAPVDTIDDSHRFTGASFSDYASRYTGMSVVDMKSQTTNYYSVEPDNGLTYNLGSNPFLQYGTEEMYGARRLAVLDALQKINYVPFRATAIGNPAYDLGDVLIFSNGIADGSESCLTKYVFGYNDRYEMQGVGKDPALASVKSKSDKNIAGLLANVESNELATYGYINADALTCGDNEWVTAVNVEFATVNPKAKIDVWAEILLNVGRAENADKVVCDVAYYLSEKEQLYHPCETWNESGYHILGLHYFIGDVEENTRYQWIVLIKLQGGTAEIASGDIHALISGQGMAAGDGGNLKSISADDTYPGYLLQSNSFEVGHFLTAVDVHHAEPDHPQGVAQAFRSLALRHGGLEVPGFQEDIVTVTKIPE